MILSQFLMISSVHIWRNQVNSIYDEIVYSMFKYVWWCITLYMFLYEKTRNFIYQQISNLITWSYKIRLNFFSRECSYFMYYNILYDIINYICYLEPLFLNSEFNVSWTFQFILSWLGIWWNERKKWVKYILFALWKKCFSQLKVPLFCCSLCN